ncbi:MAG: phosphohistidine phosphatase SixA [Nitrososphaera sp.]
MELFVLRHGEAGKRLLPGGKDSERPLTMAGKEEIAEIAKALFRLDVNFDFVATSPLKRSLQTAEIVAKQLKVKKGNFEEWTELKPEGSRQELYRKLAQFKPESSVLVVGHEPYLSAMISELVFASSAANIVLKKGGFAKIGLTSLQPKAKGELRWLLTPKHLRKIGK